MNITTNDNAKCDLALVDLYNVDDPEIGLNVVDLGLIYRIEFNEADKILDMMMTLTTQFCPMGDSIQSNVTQSLMRTFPEWKVNVNMTFEPPWSQAMISEEGKKFLGYY